MDRYDRIVVAGNRTLLFVNDAIAEPARLEAVLDADQPLRCAVERVLALEPIGPESDGVTVEVVRLPDGRIAAVEARRTLAELQPLRVAAWEYPGLLLPSTSDPVEAAAMITGPTYSVLLPDLPAFVSGVRQLFADGRALRDLRLIERGTGAIRMFRFYGWLSEDGSSMRAPGGLSIDLTDLQAEPIPSNRFFEALVSVMPDSLVVLDAHTGDVTWSNGRVSQRLGFDQARAQTITDLMEMLHPSDRPIVEALGHRLRGTPPSGPVEDRFRVRDVHGQWRWLQAWATPWASSSDGSVHQILCMVRDVDKAVRDEERMAWEAGHDPLTGLANRRVVADTLQQSAAAEDDRKFVYFIDLDDFKKVNDAYGHSIGDELLRALAARISMLITPPDVAGRFGGDELVIVSSSAPEHLAERLLAAVRRPVMLAGTELTVTTSIGVARVAISEDPGDVVRRANEAMYTAKRGGGNRYVIAGPLNTGPAQRRVKVESELRRAVAGSESQLQMAFQPIVDSNRIPVAAEALLRWEHPTRGTLRPSQFLDVAEAAGLMSELSELIVRQSIGAVASWRQVGQPLMVTVNAGRRELGSGRFYRLIADALADTGTRPEQVCLEVTESVLVDAGSPELAELWRLRDLGLEIALDDFGTGFAPLTYLKRLPATILKLDKSFVSGLGHQVPNAVDLAVSRAVAQLAEELGMRLIAEGVESERQMITLMSIGYHYFQGFWAHPPMAAGEVTALLAVS